MATPHAAFSPHHSIVPSMATAEDLAGFSMVDLSALEGAMLLGRQERRPMHRAATSPVMVDPLTLFRDVIIDLRSRA